MTKYESAKYLVRKKARIQHECHGCGKLIKVGELYFKETVDMWPPRTLVLFEFCEKCGIELQPKNNE